MAWSGFMMLHPFAVMIYGKLLHGKKRVEKNEKLCLELIIIIKIFEAFQFKIFFQMFSK